MLGMRIVVECCRRRMLDVYARVSGTPIATRRRYPAGNGPQYTRVPKYTSIVVSSSHDIMLLRWIALLALPRV
jgi:hypothetical protein